MASKRNAAGTGTGGASETVQRGGGHSEVTKSTGQAQRERRIVQITAAPAGYKLVFIIGDVQQLVRPSAVALVEDAEGRRTVHFLDENGQIADDIPCFSDVIDFGGV